MFVQRTSSFVQYKSTLSITLTWTSLQYITFYFRPVYFYFFLLHCCYLPSYLFLSFIRKWKLLSQVISAKIGHTFFPKYWLHWKWSRERKWQNMMRRCSGQLRNSTNHKEGIERNEIQSWTDSRESTEMKRDQKILRVDSRDKDLIRIWYIPSFFGNFWYIIRNFERNDVSTEGKEFDPSGCLFNTRERGRETRKKEILSLKVRKEPKRKDGSWKERKMKLTIFLFKKVTNKSRREMLLKMCTRKKWISCFLFCTVLSMGVRTILPKRFAQLWAVLLERKALAKAEM